MSISRHSNITTRIPIGLVFALCIGLIIATVLSFPSPSRANLEPVQETRSEKKTKPARFAPGKVLVRYKSESIAANKTGALRITAKDGQLLSLRIEEFEASTMVPGLRVARVADDDTLAVVAAMRGQPDVMYA